MRHTRLSVLLTFAAIQTIALAAAQGPKHPELKRPEKRAATSEKSEKWTRENSGSDARRDRDNSVERNTTDRDQRASTRQTLDKASAWVRSRAKIETGRYQNTAAEQRDSTRDKEAISARRADKASRWDQRKATAGQSAKNRRAALLDHIFRGEVKKGVAQGFHYEGAQMEAGYGTKVIESTRTAPDSKGVYQAKVTVRGIEKKEKSSFFPRAWSRADVMKAINEAYANRANVKDRAPNYFEGRTSNGMVIGMYCNKNGALVTAYPKPEK